MPTMTLSKSLNVLDLMEAGRILRDETAMLPMNRHLEAMAELLREAYSLLNDVDSRVSMRDWNADARKILFGNR